jgi:hypothetical protein
MITDMSLRAWVAQRLTLRPIELDHNICLTPVGHSPYCYHGSGLILNVEPSCTLRSLHILPMAKKTL